MAGIPNVFATNEVRRHCTPTGKPWYEQLMPGVYHQLQTVIVGEVIITPEAADKILREHNRPEGNRRILATQLSLLSRSILAGDFILTGETIIFDTNGNVINGQHRLTACVEANRSIPALVVLGVAANAFSVLDQHAKRTVGQVLQMLNHTNANALGASLMVLNNFLSTGIMYRAGHGMTVGENLRLLAEHPGLHNTIAFLGSHAKGTRLFGSTSIPIVGHYVFRHIDPAAADLFFASFIDFKIPDGVQWEAPHLLLKRLSSAGMDRGKKLVPRLVSALLIKAWNAYYENRPCKVLKFSDEEDYPMVSGLHYTHQGKPILIRSNNTGAFNGQLQ